MVLTESQLPIERARSDARQNLIDALTCATDGTDALREVAVCFGGTLLRASRAQNTSSTEYRVFASPTYPELALLGVDIKWNRAALWRDPEVYRPRFALKTRVIRTPVVPGCDPRMAYGDLYQRGVRGVPCSRASESGNMPDQRGAVWLEWLKAQRKEGLEVYLASECVIGSLHSDLSSPAFSSCPVTRSTADAGGILKIGGAHPGHNYRWAHVRADARQNLLAAVICATDAHKRTLW